MDKAPNQVPSWVRYPKENYDVYDSTDVFVNSLFSYLLYYTYFYSILNVNGTTRGCLEATSAGLLHTRLDSECDNEQVPSCQYTACLTTTGKKCLFPFKYMNTSHPDLTYTICSTLDAYRYVQIPKNQNLVLFRFVLKTENLSLLYRPWCPTELDEQLNVIEWGDCMDYCPTEPVNSACLEEPEFPVFSDGTGLTANYTSTYERGSGIVTDEVCENIFFFSFLIL